MLSPFDLVRTRFTRNTWLRADYDPSDLGQRELVVEQQDHHDESSPKEKF
ncbi:MAG TPA: hypothetical protein VIJ87_04185 [Pyrinomonadaceae bacterium]